MYNNEIYNNAASNQEAFQQLGHAHLCGRAVNSLLFHSVKQSSNLCLAEQDVILGSQLKVDCN